MSTLRVSNVADTSGNNSSTPAAIANGIAKAWVNFNGTGTVAIRASYNVSSITDNGTGDYTVNFTNALADANYSACVVCSPNTTNSARLFCQVFTNGTGTSAVAPSSSAFRFAAFNNSTSTNFDPDYACASIFR